MAGQLLPNMVQEAQGSPSDLSVHHGMQADLYSSPMQAIRSPVCQIFLQYCKHKQGIHVKLRYQIAADYLVESQLFCVLLRTWISVCTACVTACSYRQRFFNFRPCFLLDAEAIDILQLIDARWVCRPPPAPLRDFFWPFDRSNDGSAPCVLLVISTRITGRRNRCIPCIRSSISTPIRLSRSSHMHSSKAMDSKHLTTRMHKYQIPEPINSQPVPRTAGNFLQWILSTVLQALCCSSQAQTTWNEDKNLSNHACSSTAAAYTIILMLTMNTVCL